METSDIDKTTEEDSATFWKAFNDKCCQCRVQIEELTAANAVENEAAVKILLRELQEFATDAARFLPMFVFPILMMFYSQLVSQV